MGCSHSVEQQCVTCDKVAPAHRVNTGSPSERPAALQQQPGLLRRGSSSASSAAAPRRESADLRRSSWKLKERPPGVTLLDAALPEPLDSDASLSEQVTDPTGESEECLRTMSTLVIPLLEEPLVPLHTPKADRAVSPSPLSRASQRSRRQRIIGDLEARAELHRCNSAGTRSAEPGPMALSISGSIRTLVARVRCGDHQYEPEPPISPGRLRQIICRVNAWQRQLDASPSSADDDLEIVDV